MENRNEKKLEKSAEGFVGKVFLFLLLSRAVPKVLQPFSPLLKAAAAATNIQIKNRTYHSPKICMLSIRYIDSRSAAGGNIYLFHFFLVFMELSTDCVAKK